MPSHIQTMTIACRRAGAYLSREFDRARRPTVRQKTPHNLVTKADRHAEQMIVSVLRRAFAGYNFLNEEGGTIRNGASEYEWLIDPIDGTTNFSVKVPFFCIAIGLLRLGEPVAGAIYQPVTRELYTAELGKRAHLNGKRIRVSRVAMLREATVNYGHGVLKGYSFDRQWGLYERLSRRTLKVRGTGSTALSLAYVAAGRFDATVDLPPLSPWDLAAGTLLVREAGGTVTTLFGKRWTPAASDIVASNGALHPNLLRTIRA